MCKTFLDNKDYSSVGVKGDKDSKYVRYDFTDNVKDDLTMCLWYRLVINNNKDSVDDVGGMLIDYGCDYMSLFIGENI